MSNHPTNHIIGIGGTGTKCVDAMVHLAACGLLPDINGDHADVNVSLFDQDEGNGNLAATIALLNTYAQLQETLGKQLSTIDANSALFRSELVKPDGAANWYWMPLEKRGARLSSMFQLSSLEPNLRHFAQCLYKWEDELQMDLTYGFRGRPAVGAAIISGSRDEGHPFWDYIDRRLKPTGSVFLAGSVFGGTGAAGLPTIARLIKKTESSVMVGAAMMLPYFSYIDPSDSASDKELQSVALAAEMPLRSQLALDFYARTLGSKDSAFFDVAYPLGLPKPLRLGYMNPGGADQLNPALLPELYAALAAGHFFRNGKKTTGNLQVCSVGGDLDKGVPRIRWSDLPSPLDNNEHNSVRAKLGRLLRFAFAYYYVYHPYLFPTDPEERRRNSRERWYLRLIHKDGTRLSLNNESTAPLLYDYCQRLLRWYAALGLVTQDRQALDLSQLLNVTRYAELVPAIGNPPEQPPQIQLQPSPSANPKGNNDQAAYQRIAEAFDALLGEERPGGLEYIYEGLSRQKTEAHHGYTAFVYALWRACALTPPLD